VAKNRVDRVRALLAEAGLNKFVVSCREHVRYLSGFSGSSGWLIIGPDEQVLLTDFRYQEQASEQSPEWTFHLVRRGLPYGVREVLQDSNGERIGFENTYLTVREYEQLSSNNGDTDAPAVEWVSTDGLLGKLTVLKDDGEIDRIRKAAAITDTVFEELLDLLAPGVRERDVAAEIEYRMRRHGADGTSFPSIVAAGEHGSLPHATPSDREISRGEMVTIDMGAELDGYNSDMTRTVSVGEPSGRMRRIYGIVYDAQMRAVEAVRPGISCVELDGIARSVIDNYGHAEHFGHGLGHGVGIRVHDAPSVSPRGTQDLEEGMVITIEPGIYVPGLGGVRIEDLVVVRHDGAEILSNSSKDLITLE